MSRPYHALSTTELLDHLRTTSRGLDEAEAAARLERHGRNELPAKPGDPIWRTVARQFANIMIAVLLAAAALSYILGDISDVIVIVAIVILNAAIGAWQEHKADKALAALSSLQVPLVTVRRNGEAHQISSVELVPGDIALLSEGDRIPADGRVLTSATLRVNEAPLTGESVPVAKTAEPVPEEASLGDRVNMVYLGTEATYGRGEMVVTGTGPATEMGKIAGMLSAVEQTASPLQKRLDRLSVVLVRGAILAVGAVFIAGMLRGFDINDMLLTSISLAVAAVPEGLPAIVTVTLSLGAARLVKRHALIRRLPAVETLGSVTTICSDKTGTLTRNEMTVTRLALPGGRIVRVTGAGYAPRGEFFERDASTDPRSDTALARLLQSMALSTNAHLDSKGGEPHVIGDSTEGALVVAAAKAGYARAELEREYPRVAELPFSSERKAMSTVHGCESAPWFGSGRFLWLTKGAPDKLLEWSAAEWRDGEPRPLTEEGRREWRACIEKLAADGLRVLALAAKPIDQCSNELDESMERDLVLLGLTGILDPARPEATVAVQTARRAGIRPVMVTGDHALTATAVARELSIASPDHAAVTGVEIERMDQDALADAAVRAGVLARVSPEHKLRLVRALQARNEIVAMTGDGVNDAPALKQADIGVAMGITGTDVSKGAADMVLTDDNFSSIVSAVEEGRAIYENIRKFILYLLASNVGELLVMLFGIAAGLPVPLLAVQILWINLVTDGLPATALAFDPAEPGLMRRPPRPPNESIFARRLGRRIVTRSLLLSALTLGAYWYGFSIIGIDWFAATAADDIRLPRTLAFTVLALGQIFHVLSISAGEEPFHRVGFSHNFWMLAAVSSTLLLQLGVVYVPAMQDLFQTVPLTASQLAVAMALSAAMLAAAEIGKKMSATSATSSRSDS